MFFKCDKMSYSRALTVKTILVFVEYIFQFFINKALRRLRKALTGWTSWAKVLKTIHLTKFFVISCHGTIDNALTLHVGGLGFDSCHWKLFILALLLLLLLFFRKTYFVFLTDLKYTSRLIAGSLSAFISKIQ